MKKYLYLGVLLVSLSLRAVAQDAHFSQYYASPLTLNPAMTGFFDGKYRVNTIYRNQWQDGLKTKAYKTVGVGLDVRFPMKRRHDAFGAGLLLYNDKAGTGNFSTTQFGVSGSFLKALDFDGNNVISGGLQWGIVQRTLTYENITFNDQFNGSNGFTLPTGEALPRNNFAYNDLNAGVTWAHRGEHRKTLYAGLAAHHATRPNVSFYTGDGVPTVRLPIKLAVQLGAQLPLGEPRHNNDWMPRFIAYWQGQHLEMNIGSGFRFAFTPYGDSAFHLGMWARSSRDVKNAVGLDGLVAMTGLEYKGLIMGFSYDLNLNDIPPPGQQRAAFELSISFIGEYEDDSVSCPTF